MQGPLDGVDVLAGIARAVATGAPLDDVFGLLARAAPRLLPFDHAGVCWMDGAGAVELRDLCAEGAARRTARSDLSPQLWPPAAFEAGLLGEAPARLDPAFRLDREIAEAGVRALMRAPVGRAADPPGLLWLGARAPGALTAGHVRLAQALADLVSLALAQDRLSRAESERRRRTDALESLLPALADALDVRDVFRRVSRIAQHVLPHEALGLGLFSEDHTRISVFASSDPEMAHVPEFSIPPEMAATLRWEFFVARDIALLPGGAVRFRVYGGDGAGEQTIEVTPPPMIRQLLEERRIRSQIRVPLSRGSRVVGWVVFNSTTPDRYRPEDGDVARRIADHVALALSHQELADEARRLDEAQERAAALETRVAHLTEELEAKGTHRVLGRSRKWKDVLAQATKVAATDTTVLITGESGTGKEVVARFLHRASTRSDGPFVALNCAALPEQLLESELFGHEKGAFTGAVAQRAGRIEQAQGGVLFLDEVGEMSPAVQAKFLRVLQEREFQRLGGARTIKADVRVLAATNRDLKAAVAGGGFREDLFYRLAVFDLALPPLRERPEDLLLLVDAFLDEIGRAIGRVPAGISHEVRDTLLAYPWPGNVRELRNAIERAVILCEGSLITSEHLPITLKDRVPAPSMPAAEPDFPAGGVDLDAIEKNLVLKALERARNNKAQAAKLLGLTRSQLYSRLGKHGLQP